MIREGPGGFGAVALPALVATVGLTVWTWSAFVVGAAFDLHVGLGVVAAALVCAVPGAARAFALGPHGPRVLVAAIATVPVAALGTALVTVVGFASAFGDGGWSADDQAVLTAVVVLVVGLPVAAGLAAFEGLAMSAATERRTGAGVAAAGLVLAWFAATATTMIGLAYGWFGDDGHPLRGRAVLAAAALVQAVGAATAGAVGRQFARPRAP